MRRVDRELTTVLYKKSKATSPADDGDIEQSTLITQVLKWLGLGASLSEIHSGGGNQLEEPDIIENVWNWRKVELEQGGGEDEGVSKSLPNYKWHSNVNFLLTNH